MRYIDISQLQLPTGWEEKAKKLTEQLEEIVDPDKRAEFIDKHKIWSELKSAFEKLSNNKCWYTEAKARLSLYDIDHFRPKGKIKNYDGSIDNSEGYWWLAFEWRNYRLSGQICNRPNKDIADGITKGKHNYFPLKKGSSFATKPGDDISAEIFYLLDPTDEDDPYYLSFDRTGDIYPFVSEETFEYQRADVTIKLLNLRFERLKDARREKWQYCDRLVNEAQNLMIEANGQTSIKLITRLKEIRKTLRDMLAKESELSSVARACLLNSEYYWARNLVAN